MNFSFVSPGYKHPVALKYYTNTITITHFLLPTDRLLTVTLEMWGPSVVFAGTFKSINDTRIVHCTVATVCR